jgi:MarR family 2-MHQ and catechol resistance regulon transcriptional repressor
LAENYQNCLLTNVFVCDIILISKDLIWRFLMPTHFQGDPKTVLALDTFIKFTRAASALENRLLRHGTLGDLTLSQFGVLEILYHMGPMCQGEISAKLLKSSGNVTLVLDNLEHCGLVERRRETGDRRKVMLYLTPAGEELIKRIFPQQAAIIAAEFGVLDAAEQEQLGQLCRKLGKSSPASPSSDHTYPFFDPSI